MPKIRVVVDGNHERLARELKLDRMPVVHSVAEWTIDVMDHGMRSGRTSLMVLIPVRIEGVTAMVAAETSLNAWMMATAVIRGHCQAEVNEPGWATLSPEARALLLPRFAEGIVRAIPSATLDQALVAAEMFLDGIGADAPPDAGTPR